MKRIYTFILLWITFVPVIAQMEVQEYNRVIDSEIVLTADIKSMFYKSAKINLSDYEISDISSFRINVNFSLFSDTSFVRITLENIKGNEFLVLEANNLLFEDKANLSNYFEETGYLDNEEVIFMNITICDAELWIDSITYTGKLSQGESVKKRNTEYVDFLYKEKIKKINERIKDKNLKWFAGETEISKLSFEEKKVLFNGDIPNLYCVEFYKGGIYELPTNKKETADVLKSSTPIIDNFDWRNRHGRNWNTSVKRQTHGICWAYTVVGTTEAMTNLYFNRNINHDLSEYAFVACSGGSCTSGGNSFDLFAVSTIGLIDQNCFPNGNCATICSDTCSIPTEKIFSNGVERFLSNSYSDPELELKKFVIKYGIGYVGLTNWSHAMALSGFGTVHVNDTILIDTLNYTNNIVISDNDSRIGKSYWIFKNSWGPSWGHNGYFYVIADVNYQTMGYPMFVKLPILSKQYKEKNRLCEDRDGDGYYNWGIGEKPATCPDCSLDIEDGDDSDPTVGPMDEYGNLTFITSYTYPIQTITTTQVVTDTLSPCENLVIESGATLVIHSTGLLIMPNSANITIKSGGKLYVISGRIKNSDIVVKSGGELQVKNNSVLWKDWDDELVIEQGGLFSMENSCSIEYIGDSTLY